MTPFLRRVKECLDAEQRAIAERRQQIQDFGKTVALDKVLSVEPVTLELYGRREFVVSKRKLAAELAAHFPLWAGECDLDAIHADVEARLEAVYQDE